MGGSYGGYSTLYTMEMYPDLFQVGIANSGVADWRLYDTIYTERYMSTLEDNKSGYEVSSAVVNASKLKGKLLMIHAMMDDNVHPQNTMQLLTAFTDAGKDIETRIYPPGRHGSAYSAESARLINEAQFDFLNRWMGPSGGAVVTASCGKRARDAGERAEAGAEAGAGGGARREAGAAGEGKAVSGSAATKI
jgi:dipeptidyl-peptidase-4